jgi:hypothetical protein
MSEQLLAPGQLEETFRRELQFYLEHQIVQRLWAKDCSLWPEELISKDPALAQLDWVSLPDALAPHIEFLGQAFASADADGFVDHALLTSESLNLTVRAFLQLAGAAPGRKMLIFDSVAPEIIRANEEQLDLRRTLFVLSNKERYGLRDHCLFLYFQEKLRALVGDQASHQLVAETQPNTFLAELSRGYGFRDLRVDATDIPGPYCSLRHFGGLLTATRFKRPEEIMAEVWRVRAECSPTVPPERNPALQLAAYLSSATSSQRSYVAFVVSPSLLPYARRLAQLVGGSLTRGRAGLLPLIWPLPSPIHGLQRHALFAVLSYVGDHDEDVRKTIAELRSNDEPVVHIQIEKPGDLLPDLFKWEAATILACARLGMDPFDLDKSRVPRTFVTDMLDELAQGKNPMQRSMRITDRFLQLYVDGVTRSEISTLNFPEALRSFFRISTPLPHVTLIVDIPRTEELHDKFVVLRNLISTVLMRPVLLAFGPYGPEYGEHFFRHSFPYGPSILFTADALMDLAIPGAHYTFGQLHQVMALSEYDTLVHWRRPAIRLHLERDFPAALDHMLRVFEHALHRFQPEN